ncbi:MAG TPA: DUF2877 domain-containing protein, partial [Acidimicrobiia bacterium]|nr:DUF2877 domain-containing protein [Acidimicrobiia bacterium]
MRGPGTGRVLWARDADPAIGYHGQAAWLRLPDGVVGLAPPGAPLGPRWIQRAEPWPSLTEGDPVTVDSDGLHASDGALFLESRQAVGWLGPLPDPTQLSGAAARALISDALSSCKRSSLLDPPWHTKVKQAASAIGRLPPLDALTIVAGALGGLGPGLTPAGDDMLSGILFAVRAMNGPMVEPALLDVARSVRTSDLATALLEAAAGGYQIEPVHDLVTAAATGDTKAAARAAADLDRFGSSSGADIAHGLRLA